MSLVKRSWHEINFLLCKYVLTDLSLGVSLNIQPISFNKLYINSLFYLLKLVKKNCINF